MTNENALKLAILYQAIINAKDSSNEQFLIAVEAKDEFLSTVWSKE